MIEKLEFSEKFRLKSPILNFNKICGTIYELYGKDHLWSYVKQALL
jgi:hypothetical protein